MSFQSFVRGRRVALVGPSRSIGGSGYGPAIDAHDLVVRINHGWPISERLRPDLGRRLDILYHCCNGDRPVERVFATGIDRLRWACFEDGLDHRRLLDRCSDTSVESLDVTDVYVDLRRDLGTFPNTGLVAIHHLLSAGAARVALFGMTFFREPYLPGYPADGADAAHWPVGGPLPARVWEHDLPVQYRHFTELCRRERRVTVDSVSLAVMPEVGEAISRRGLR
jgi:hypothetical protein